MSFVFFIPSFYGDIRLQALDGKRTQVFFEKITPREKAALEAVRKQAAAKGWADLGTMGASGFELAAPLLKVQKIISKVLKPDRKLLSVVKFSDGKMEELNEATFSDVIEGGGGQALAAKPEAATTVAEPARGCPVPEFAQAEVRARRVLDVFLTPEQQADFRSRQQFLSRGADSGHLYMVTSRHALRGRFVRSLHDLDNDMPICTHDYTVPAAEEVLALHLMVSLPGRETFAREMAEGPGLLLG